MTDSQFVAAVTVAILSAWGAVFGVVALVDFLKRVAGR